MDRAKQLIDSPSSALVDAASDVCEAAGQIDRFLIDRLEAALTLDAERRKAVIEAARKWERGESGAMDKLIDSVRALRALDGRTK